MDPDSSFYFLTINIVNFLNILLLIILLFCSALISGTEIAFFSLTQNDINQLSNQSNKKNVIITLLEQPKKLLGTILITNNFINILIVLVFANISENLLSNFNYNINFYFFQLSLLFIIEIVLATFLILFFGEVLPKIYANRKPLQFSKFMAKPIIFLRNLLNPFSVTLIKLTNLIESRLGNKNNNFSVETLSQALELTTNTNTSKEEKKFFEGIVSFGNTETVQIMKPRTDVCAISFDEDYEEVLKIILKNGFSRNPVYKDNIDCIVGVLYAKDLLAFLNKKNFKWQGLIREAFYVPENKKLDDLLSDFQEMKNHMAIVVDEYGGTSGIVTLEDVIEEIVGDINDEFDDDYLYHSKIDENNYVFEGKTTIKDFCRILNEDEELFEQEKGESETLAGFILELSGKFPKRNEKIKFNKFLFTIEEIDRKRIKRIKFTRNA